MGNWTPDFSHAKRALYPWAIPPRSNQPYWCVTWRGLWLPISYQMSRTRFSKLQHLWEICVYCIGSVVLLCLFLEKMQRFGGMGNWTPDFSHAKRALYPYKSWVENECEQNQARVGSFDRYWRAESGSLMSCRLPAKYFEISASEKIEPTKGSFFAKKCCNFWCIKVVRKLL